jgi:hypothetical protein
MKLRLHANRIRLRLSPREVQRLARGTAIEERVPLVPQPLIYHLRAADVRSCGAAFSGGVLDITLIRHAVEQWAAGDDVGINATVTTPTGDAIELLIEKDFQCLHGTPAEQDDCYPNPLAT